MAKKFSDLCAKMSPSSRAQADAMARAMLAEMLLHEGLQTGLDPDGKEAEAVLTVHSAPSPDAPARPDSNA